MTGSLTAATPPLDAPLPPRVSALPLVGLLPRWRKDPLGILDMLRDGGHGDVVRLHNGVDITVLGHPDGIRHVLQENHSNYRKGFDYDRLQPFVGQGLLTANGDVWRRHRRLAQPAFHKQRVQSWSALMLTHTEAMLARWRALPAGATLDIHREMMRLTLEIVGQALFSSELGPFVGQVGDAMDHAMRLADQRINHVIAWPTWVPTPFNRALNRHVGTLDEVVEALIERRRADVAAGAPAGDDLLGLLMAASDEGSGPPLTPRELRDEVMTLIVAGHETTANALTFSLLLLSKHREVRTALASRVDAHTQGRAVQGDDAGKLTFARQVAEESMRLYPPAWTVSREAIADDVVSGFRVPKGSLVMMAPWMVQRDARFWPEPLRFDPTRFDDTRSEDRARLTYFPFGAGPRMCIGKSFAMMELELILARLAQEVEVTLEAPEAVELEPTITLRPKGAVPARVGWRGV